MALTKIRPYLCCDSFQVGRNSVLRECALQRAASFIAPVSRSRSKHGGQTPSTSQPTPQPHSAFAQGRSLRSFQEIEQKVQHTIEQPAVPSEEDVNEALKTIEAAVLDLCHQLDPQAKKHSSNGSPTSAILSLSGRLRSSVDGQQSSTASHGEAESLSYLAYRLLKHPRVFITPLALEKYVMIQALGSRPESFPEIFDLYATKPQPGASTSKSKSKETSFASPKPDAAASAIPATAANLALDSAIQVRNLPLALSIVAMSFERPAFRKNKFVRKGLPPVVGAGLTPLAVWTLAANMSAIQTGLPPETFTQIAFAGIATYAAAVGTIGYVALTSANDQMRRVTWTVGMPLWERWAREEERAALDRIACAWGFKESWRWGEEDGADWAELKDWIGIRGMVLDKVGLMEGME